MGVGSVTDFCFPDSLIFLDGALEGVEGEGGGKAEGSIGEGGAAEARCGGEGAAVLGIGFGIDGGGLEGVAMVPLLEATAALPEELLLEEEEDSSA